MTSLQGTKSVAPKCPDLGGSTVNGCKIGVCLSYKVLNYVLMHFATGH